MERQGAFWLACAFTGGIAVTLGFKDVYPDLERRFRSRGWWRAQNVTEEILPLQSEPLSLENSESGHVELPEVPLGIEGCIGNTPLIKIKSLSDFTGCDILAKAEVKS